MKRKLLLIFADIFLIVLSYLGAFVLRFEFEEALNYVHFIYTSLPIIIIVTLPIFIRMGMYKAVWRYASIDSFSTIVKARLSSLLLSFVPLRPLRISIFVFLLHFSVYNNVYIFFY